MIKWGGGGTPSTGADKHYRQLKMKSVTTDWQVLTFWRLKVAESEGIAGVARAAGARRQVVHHLAVGVRTTGARTRILAPVAYAGAVRRAVRVQHAFRPTTFVRVTHVVGEAGARACSVLFPTHCVRSAGRRHAGGRSFLGKRLR